MKTRFFSNVTHEFRTPLVALSSTIQMILDQGMGDPATQRKLLASGKESLEDMLENVNDILTKSRSEKGMIEMRWSQVDIAQFVEQSLKVFEPGAKQRNNKLIFTDRVGAIREPPLRIYADRPKLKKIFNNLVGNAMKFTKNGEVEVILDCDDGTCIIQVRDSGLGIPKEDQATIFDAFTQASNNPLREVQGTGLGLAMVKDFVERHRGTIACDSQPGKGSVFTVHLPLGDAHVDLNQLDTSQLVEEGEPIERVNLGIKSFADIDFTPFSHHDSRRDDILIVEDNPQVMQVLAYVLKDHYNLHFAQNGEEGLKKADAIKPDLVMSDIMMPKMNGYELVRAIKGRHDLKMIPVILLTSKSDVESKIKGIEEGADEYLSKPFNNKEVLTRVKGLIEKSKMEMEFVHAEKLVSLGRLVAGIAHEINNPISYAKSAAERIDDIFIAMEEEHVNFFEGKALMRQAIDQIKDGTARVCTITSALKGFVRQGVAGFCANDIHKGLDSTIPIVHSNRNGKIEIHKQYDLKDEVVCNVNQLNQVFLNVLQNAIQALDKTANGQIWIRTFREDGYATVVIRDNGPGIPAEVQNKIFDPFFTTKDVGQGTGLGLYISQQIVQEHGGVLAVKSTLQQGTEFTIQLPIAGKKEESTDAKFTHASVDREVAEIQYPHRG